VANAAPDHDENSFSGFGGVGLGSVRYDAQSVLKSKEASRVLHSEFMFRAGDSPWFVGYGVGIQGGSQFSRKFVPVDGNNADAVQSANPINPDCYSEVCLASSETTYLDILHVPLELNVAWVTDIWRFSGYLGGGPALHYYRLTGHASSTMLQVVDADDDFRAYYPADPSGYTNGFMSSGKKTLSTANEREYALGMQLLGGIQYEFGKVPWLGGRWGLSLSGKAQVTRTADVQIRTKSSFREYDLDGSFLPEWSDSKQNSRRIDVNGSNVSAKLGVVYFF
jgi:hypothetical protein